MFYWLKDIVSIHDIIDYYSIITKDKSKVIYWDFIKIYRLPYHFVIRRSPYGIEGVNSGIAVE